MVTAHRPGTEPIELTVTGLAPPCAPGADLPNPCRAFGITLAKLAEGADPEDLRALGV